MGINWASDPRDLGKITVDGRGRYVVYVKENFEYYNGYKTRTYRSFDKAMRRSEKVVAKELAREEKIRKAQEVVRNRGAS